jgi:hypothetical protein
MEAFVRPELASRLIFEALGCYGDDLPESGEDFEDFVEQHLFAVLTKNLDESLRTGILESLQPILRNIKASELPPPTQEAMQAEIPAAAEVPAGQDDVTEAGLAGAEPRVLVVASGHALERRLRMAVGWRLRVTTAPTLIDVKAAVFGLTPRVIIVDATDAPEIDPTELARAITLSSPESVHVVWGTGSHWSTFLMLDMDQDRSARAMGLAVSEGVEPLIDVVRSYGLPPPPPPPEAVFKRPKG